MKSQQLTRRAVIERPSRVADDVGGTLTVWEVFKVVWCEVNFASSTNGLEFSRNGLTTSADIIVRAEVAQQIDETFRILYKNKVYTILGIRPMAGEVYTVLSCAARD
jgi:head-tail adaptor